MKKFLLFKLLSTSIAIANLSYCLVSCVPNNSNNETSKCNYTVRAINENSDILVKASPKFYIGPGIKGYVSGKWFIDGFTEDFTCYISGQDNFIGANIYIPQHVDVNGTIYTITKVGAANGCQAKVVIPDSVVELSYQCFSGSSLTSIIFNNIHTIGDACFYSCSKLNYINLKDILYLGASCFKNCTNLNNINLEKIEYLGNECFYDCKNLDHIYLTNAKHLGDRCFVGCTKLEYLNLETIEKIGQWCFYGTSIDTVDMSKLNTCHFKGALFADSYSQGVLKKIILGSRNSLPNWTLDYPDARGKPFNSVPHNGEILVSGSWNTGNNVLDFMISFGLPDDWRIN